MKTLLSKSLVPVALVLMLLLVYGDRNTLGFDVAVAVGAVFIVVVSVIVGGRR